MGRGLAVEYYYILLPLLIMVATCGGCWCQGRGCHDEERRALLEIKASINNITDGTALRDWGGLAGGGEEENCCRWSHITCNHHTGRVVDIHLSLISIDEDLLIKKKVTWYQNFTSFLHFRDLEVRDLEGLDLMENWIGGTFPTVLCELKRLKHLDLRWNSLEGSIPPCLCNMSSLTSLHLSHNPLHGSIPWCLGNLHNLQKLDLCGNEFQGSIPPSIFPNLTKLTAVAIGGDRLEGTLSFSVFANLSNLVNICISSNHGLEIETESPSWVPSFQLEILYIGSCVVNRRSGGRLPSFISSTQTRLRILQLADVSMTGTIPLWLLCNSSLVALFLPRNKLHGTFHLPCHNASHNIKSIHLSQNRVHGSLPTDLGFSFPNLAALKMAGNELRGSIPSSLGQARFLFALDLSHNDFSGKLPETLTRNHTTLMYLNVSNNQLEGEMLPTDPFMPSLQFLYLHHNRFTGSIPSKISNSSLLKALDIGHNDLTCSLSQCLPTFPL